jgi:hypothetical protein
VIIGPRLEAALLATVGLALAASYLWWQQLWLASVGAVITGVSAAALIGAIRRPPILRERDRRIRSLWALARRIPGDTVLVDPRTGRQINIGRQRRLLTLAVADPADQPKPTITRYMLGFAAAASPAPLFRHTTTRHRPAPATLSLQQACELLRHNERSGATQARTDELADVHAQLKRAIVAVQTGPVAPRADRSATT